MLVSAAGSRISSNQVPSSRSSGVTGILFTQRQAVSPVPPTLIEEFWAGINAATEAP
jgi:hypothetical protein